jgi:hypothetical protein
MVANMNDRYRTKVTVITSTWCQEAQAIIAEMANESERALHQGIRPLN